MWKKRPGLIIRSIPKKKNMNKPTFVYIYDPLCGWCFGFIPVLERLRKRFEGRLEFEIVCGGLAVGDNAQPIGEGYAYIRDALKQTEEVTGVRFGENFKLLAEEGSYLYDSMPPCKAQIAVRELAPAEAIDFGTAMQKALFLDGKDLNLPDTYKEILEDFEPDYDSFSARYESKELIQKTREEFEWSRKAGATGFPTILLRLDREYGIVTKGYRPYDALESHLHHLLNNIEKIRN